MLYDSYTNSKLSNVQNLEHCVDKTTLECGSKCADATSCRAKTTTSAKTTTTKTTTTTTSKWYDYHADEICADKLDVEERRLFPIFEETKSYNSGAIKKGNGKYDCYKYGVCEGEFNADENKYVKNTLGMYHCTPENVGTPQERKKIYDWKVRKCFTRDELPCDSVCAKESPKCNQQSISRVSTRLGLISKLTLWG